MSDINTPLPEDADDDTLDYPITKPDIKKLQKENNDVAAEIGNIIDVSDLGKIVPPITDEMSVIQPAPSAGRLKGQEAQKRNRTDPEKKGY